MNRLVLEQALHNYRQTLRNPQAGHRSARLAKRHEDAVVTQGKFPSAAISSHQSRKNKLVMVNAS
jgi:hypothetical protein